MATNDRTIAAVLRMRLELDRYVSAADRDLARMWSAAWQEIVDEVASAAGELAALADDDGWPRRAAVLRNQRAQNALKATVEAVRELAQRAGVRMTEDLAAVLDSAEHWTRAVTATQMPATVTLRWARVDADALEAIVTRTTKRMHALTRPLTADAEARMKSVLIRGVAVGDSPRAAARQIVARCEREFNGGLARALNIARTEMLDAHRTAALKSRMANRDVLGGWRWHCELAKRTCPSCLAQNGTLHALDERGPDDHQQGRCTAVPVTKSWRDLGFDVEEPEPEWPDARQWFDDQPHETRLAIMGPDRLSRYESGRLSWDQMSQRVETPGWRPSYRVRPLA